MLSSYVAADATDGYLLGSVSLDYERTRVSCQLIGCIVPVTCFTENNIAMAPAPPVPKQVERAMATHGIFHIENAIAEAMKRILSSCSYGLDTKIGLNNSRVINLGYRKNLEHTLSSRL